MQDVPAYAARAGLSFHCYYDENPAPLQGELCVRVGYEAYVFCSPSCLERFVPRMIEDCGQITDPVTKARFVPTPASPRIDWGGVIYLFENGTSQGRFRAAPQDYVLPNWRMRKRMGSSPDQGETAAATDEEHDTTAPRKRSR